MSRPHLSRYCLAPLASVLLSSCTSLSGLDGGSSYACKAPPGIRCQSVSAVYQSSALSNAPGPAAPTLAASPASFQVQTLRSSPRVLRLWIKPWVDSDGDLYDQGYVYVQVDQGRWQLDGAQHAVYGSDNRRLAPPTPSTERRPVPPAPTTDNAGNNRLQARVPQPLVTGDE